MALSQSVIQAAILASINNNGSNATPPLDGPDSINKFASDLATIIVNAIESAVVTIPFADVTANVISTSPGSPVVCTTNLTGTLS
jgi:hypothetical protein